MLVLMTSCLRQLAILAEQPRQAASFHTKHLELLHLLLLHMHF